MMGANFMAGMLKADASLGFWWAAYVWSGVAILGACLGSFGNVLIYRLPRNLSVVGPRSFCPQCKSPVAWYDNVPVLGWLFLRGKCRHCGTSIPVRYLVFELLGALCLVLGFLRFGFTIHGLAAGLLLLLLLIVAVIDWQHMIIPHTLTLAGTCLGLGTSLQSSLGWPASLIGMLAGAGLILLISYGYKLVRGQVGMGGGDVMMMGMLGSFTGPWGVPAVLFAGALTGTLYAIVYGGRVDDGAAKLPFGTFLALGGALVYFYGQELFAWYLNII